MKALIIGAGIGGLTTAIALHQRGIDYEIHERAPELRAVGAGIGLGPNAMHVFEKLGLDGEIRKHSAQIREAGLYRENGDPISCFDYRDLLANEMLLGRAIHRAELQAVLLERVDPSRIHLGHRCVAITETDDGVDAAFADGSTARGDILIGADGLHSAVRHHVSPGVALRDSGQTCWRGVAAVSRPPEQRGALVEIWGSRGDRFGSVDIGAGQIYWFAVTLAPRGEHDAPGTATKSLLERFDRFPTICAELVRGTEENEILRGDLLDFAPIRRWHRGRTCLIGDAAHATTPNLGQGGCQAIEDALALAICLQKSSPPTAFERFEAARAPKTRFVVNTSWRLGQMAHYRNPLARRVRDLLLGHLPRRLQRSQIAKILDMSYLERL